MSTAHYPDGCDRLTLTRAAGVASRPRPTFCPLGVQHCAFDYRRLTRGQDNERRSVGRARGAVVDLARCNSLDTLVTLTAGRHLRSQAEALDAVSAFLAGSHGRWFRRHTGVHVTVAEPFSGDGWHIHIGIRDRLPSPVLIHLSESWTRYLADAKGVPTPSRGGYWRVNVSPPRSRHTPATLGAYLAKHLAPSAGQKCYRCAMGMARAIKDSMVVLMTAAAAWALAVCFGHPRRIVDPRSGTMLGWTSEGLHAPAFLARLAQTEVGW